MQELMERTVTMSSASTHHVSQRVMVVWYAALTIQALVLSTVLSVDDPSSGFNYYYSQQSSSSSDDHDYNDSKCAACDESLINRGGFPDGFIFGSASAAYQMEGAYNASAKGPTMWDYFTHTYPGKIKDHSNGDVAIDSYHLYKEDVKLLKDMGVDAYKFSISWARILPGGTISKGVNQVGIDYYNNLINELLANGIQPWVTILHLDTPQALEDTYGGFLSSKIVADFQDFANILFREFGDRVKHWITINEPWALAFLGYTTGAFAPARCSGLSHCIGGHSGIEPYKVVHNQLLAHAAAVKLYKERYQQVQKGEIGITVNSFWFVPYDETQANRKAAGRAIDFMLGWVMDPLSFGRYPETMRTRVAARLPEFTNEEAEMVKGSLDFLGINYYGAYYALHSANHNTFPSYLTDGEYIRTGVKNGIPIGQRGRPLGYYYMYPKGLRELLRYIKAKYTVPAIYITENGIDEDRNDSIPMSEALKDYKRKDNFVDHLCCLREAIQEDGANVKGYFAWALIDNFEWASGYLVRFGLHYVDFRDKSFRRYPKQSALWYQSILHGRIQKPQSSRTYDQ